MSARSTPAVAAALRAAPDVVYGAATVARDIENAALAAVSPDAANRVTAVDRRFDRALRELREEFRARADDVPEHPEVGDRVALDLAGFLGSIVAFGIVMAGMSSTFTGAPAAWTATAFAVFAAGCHLGNAVAARHEPPNRNSPGYLVLSTLALATAAGVGTMLAPGVWAPFAVLVACTVVVAGLAVRAIVRWLPIGRGAAAYRAALDALTAELERRLSGPAADATAEWRSIVTALPTEARERFEADRVSGMAAFAARDDVVRPAGFDAGAPAGALRYRGARI
ncbi:hypothetical protein MUN74_08400 [Agromyces endophyticus]|uniref:hypothetical protein n=1 Tax=Agromyces sp. H17E-10 TaxID=2932244 RepID=UPI001FD4617D|nr:hypothetical protein [Agromyces sp. H17E-10]UOQ90906.1 hypothetical protein MUN74_08400 [Agromyces sp. H17E-10]